MKTEIQITDAAYEGILALLGGMYLLIEKEKELTKKFPANFDIVCVSEKTNFKEDLVAVEIANKDGDKGWVYAEATLFLFSFQDCFSLVFWKDLQQFVAEKFADGEISPKIGLYKMNKSESGSVFGVISEGNIKEISLLNVPK